MFKNPCILIISSRNIYIICTDLDIISAFEKKHDSCNLMNGNYAKVVWLQSIRMYCFEREGEFNIKIYSFQFYMNLWIINVSLV